MGLRPVQTGYPSGDVDTPLSGYQRRLVVFLSVATFFEGYDFFALSQILPNLGTEFGLAPAMLGRVVAITGLGTVAAYGIVRLADRWGRRRLLQITILGYAALTLLTAFSRTIWDFTVFQTLARAFLIGEWALSMVVAAEEFPAERRGFALGLIQGATALGSITCAGVVPMLLATPLGWRAVYVVGVAPLLLLAYARRGLRETTRFATLTAPRTSLVAIFRSPWRRRVLQLAAIWGFTYLCIQNAVVFWKEFAVTERGFTDADVARALTIASLVSLPFVFGIGRVLDTWGRRRGAVLVYLLLAASVAGAYQFHGGVALTIALTVAVFAVASVPAVLNAFTTELVPTELRADAYAWANNLLGRVGYVLAPALVGQLAGSFGWGPSVSFTAVFALVALGLILGFLPETSGRELEETAAV